VRLCLAYVRLCLISSGKVIIDLLGLTYVGSDVDLNFHYVKVRLGKVCVRLDHG